MDSFVLNYSKFYNDFSNHYKGGATYEANQACATPVLSQESTNFMFSEDSCVQLNSWFCNLPKRTWLCSFNHNSLIFLSDVYKFGTKISARYVCLSWCTLICTIFNSFWNILTFTSGKELFDEFRMSCEFARELKNWLAPF